MCVLQLIDFTFWKIIFSERPSSEEIDPKGLFSFCSAWLAGFIFLGLEPQQYSWLESMRMLSPVWIF